MTLKIFGPNYFCYTRTDDKYDNNISAPSRSLIQTKKDFY